MVYPYRVVFQTRELKENESPVSILVSVSKKRFKRAVKRNRIRRQIKEAYRLNHAGLTLFLQERGIHLDLAVLFLDKTEPDYLLLEKKMCDLLKKMEKQLNDLIAEAQTEQTNDKEEGVSS